MRLKHGPDTDTLDIHLGNGVRVADSEEQEPGVIVDYDVEGNAISVEIPYVSQRGWRPAAGTADGGSPPA